VNVFCRARRAGKTHDLITNQFLGKSNYLLVLNTQEKSRIVKQFELNKRDADRIIPWNVAREQIKGTRNSIIIDDVDLFLEMYFERRVDAVSVNGRSC